MVMDMLEKSVAPELEESSQAQITSATIDALNREFQSSLREGGKRTEVAERTRALVIQGLRARNRSLRAEAVSDLTDDILRRVTGLGFLDLLLPPVRTDLSEIAVYSHGLIQVMKKDTVRWETINLKVASEEVFRVFGLLLGGQSKALNEATPAVLAKLPGTPENPGGGRITVLHPCIAPGDYPCVNLRLYGLKPVRPEWIVEKGMLSQEMMDYLAAAVQQEERGLICGETRTGKTTLLSALANLLPVPWRIIKIEDPAEIWIDRPTVQTIEARFAPPGSEVPSFTLADGVNLAMRLSPDYLIVGEVRDGFAAEAMMSALQSGHAGCCTLHARSPRHAFERIANLMGIAKQIPAHDAYIATSESIDFIVQIRILKEVRRVTCIARVEKELRNGRPWYTPVFRFDENSPVDAPRWERVSEGNPSVTDAW
jgi:pilus assembly protein CpaF